MRGACRSVVRHTERVSLVAELAVGIVVFVLLIAWVTDRRDKRSGRKQRAYGEMQQSTYLSPKGHTPADKQGGRLPSRPYRDASKPSD